MNMPRMIRSVFPYAPVLLAMTAAGEPVLADPPAAAAPAAPEAVRFRNIVRRQLPKGANVIGLEFKVVTLGKDGEQQPVDPEVHPFHVGDSFLVRIKPQDDVYVYVFTEGPDGAKHCLLPGKEESPALVRADSEISLPDDGGWFEFEPPAGEEKFVVIALKEPNADLNLLAAAAFKEPATRLNTTDAAKKQQAEAAVGAIRDRGAKGIRTRGPIKKHMGSLTEGFDSANGKQTVIEPPQDDNPSTFVITRNGENAGPAELIIDIPLRSRNPAAPGK